MHIPPLAVKKIIKHVVRVAKTSEFSENSEVCLEQPDVRPETVLVRKVYTPEVQPDRRSVLTQVSEERASYDVVEPDLHSAATEPAAVYRLDVWTEPSPPSTVTSADRERPAPDDTDRRDGP
jgi:hypothetical protein